MTLLRIDATIQGARSASAELADLVLAEWSAARPDETVVQRHLGTDPIPANIWAAAIGGSFTPEEQRTDEQREAVALAQQLNAELRAADAAVFAFPLYNYGVSQHVKTWIDVVIAGGTPGDRLLEGKPVVLVTTRGGSYAPGSPRETWDHNTAYLKQTIGDMWGAELTVVEREFTLAGVNPALDAFLEPAALLKKAAHEAAATAGKALALTVPKPTND